MSKELTLNNEFERMKNINKQYKKGREKTKEDLKKVTIKDVLNIVPSMKEDSIFGGLIKYEDNKYVSKLIDNQQNLFKTYCFNKKGNIRTNSHIVKNELRSIIGKDDFDVNEYYKICNDIDNNFKMGYKIYSNNIRNEYLELVLSSGNELELNKKILTYIFGNFNEYIEYLEIYEELRIKNDWDKLYYIGKYLEKILGVDFINIDINVLNISIEDEILSIDEDDEFDKYLILDFFTEYEQKLNKNQERLNNQDIIEITWCYKNRIIELYSIGISKNKLINIISNELWDKNIIDRKVERSIRRKGTNGVKEMVDNKISKNVVDKIVNEFNEQKNLVEM